MNKPAKRKVVTSQGSRYTECAACEEHYITLLHASCPSCSPDTRAPAHTPALSSPESVAFLVNPGKRSSGSSFDSVAFLKQLLLHRHVVAALRGLVPLRCHPIA